MCLSATEAAVVHTECTVPSLLSTPMCAFRPKYHCRPLRVWCISGSRSPLAFLVDGKGAGSRSKAHARRAGDSRPWLDQHSYRPLGCPGGVVPERFSVMHSYWGQFKKRKFMYVRGLPTCGRKSPLVGQ